MKKILCLLLISYCSYSQNSEILPQRIQTRKVVSDSITRPTDSLYISRFKSPAARITNLRTSISQTNSFSANQINATNASINFLNVVNSAQLNSFYSPNGFVDNLSIQSSLKANPLFTDDNGLVTKVSKPQFMSIPAVAFTPEVISPLTMPQSNFSIGGIRRIVNNGEVEGQALANDHIFRLVAPITFPLNNSDQNITFRNAKICTYDRENPRDLAAVIFEVNSSIGQFPLVVSPKIVLRSSNNNSTYQCFDIKADGAGAAFNVNSQDNSYYVAVFPINSSVTANQILAAPNTYFQPWRADDNPALRLVHFIVEYAFK